METIKKIFWILMGGMLLCGCSANAQGPEPTPPLCVVTQVDVTCRSPGDILERHYTQPQKMEAVLNYLRLLEYRGQADCDPEQLIGNAYKIMVQLSDGCSHCYYQRADQYLSRDRKPWERIDPDQARQLYLLLVELPGDF